MLQQFATVWRSFNFQCLGFYTSAWEQDRLVLTPVAKKNDQA